MNCDEALVLISGHLDQVNTQEEERCLGEHLARCPACRAALADYQAIGEGVAALSREPPEALVRGVMWKLQKPKRPRRFIYGLGTLAAAAVVAVALLVLPQQKTVLVEEEAPAVQSVSRTMDVRFESAAELALVEIVDRAGAPAAEIVEAMTGLAPEAPGDYRTHIAAARKIVAACTGYTLFLPDGFDTLPDDAPCLVRITPPGE